MADTIQKPKKKIIHKYNGGRFVGYKYIYTIVIKNGWGYAKGFA
jgi:hypothetical protein